MSYWGRCKVCESESFVSYHHDYDGPDFCPECRSVDCFEEIEEEEEEANTNFNQE